MGERARFRTRAVLTAYLFFSAGALIFDFWSRSQPELHERLVPLTGWTGLSTYMWTFQFALFTLFRPDRGIYQAALGMLGFCAISEAVMTFINAYDAWAGVPNFGNPYLTYYPLRPLVTVAPPTVWFALLWWAGRDLPRASSGTGDGQDAPDAEGSALSSPSPPDGES